MLILPISQVIATLLVILFLLYDCILLTAMWRFRFSNNSNKKSYPFVYITFMSVLGITGKIFAIPMIDAWPIADWIDPINGYDAYRKSVGEEISVVKTFAYLTPLFLNCLMTFHRVCIFLMPFKTKWFSELRLTCYCSLLAAIALISLLFPYFSDCPVNFDSRTSTYVAKCAPGRHPATLLQNKYLIWLPLCSMFANFTIILWVKLSRKIKERKYANKVTATSAAHVAKWFAKRENVMIRQAAIIAVYFSVYELGFLYMRLYPEQFEDWLLEFQVLFYFLRLLTADTSNFFVYFMLTKSTRQLVLKFLGLEGKFGKKFVVITVSQTLANN